MKTLLQGMTEDQHDNRSWRCSCMVAALILLTLALNASAREQAALIRQGYNNSNENVLLLFTAIVVAGQILAATLVVTAETPRGEWPDKEAMIIIAFSHAGCMFLQDYLLSIGNAHSFMSAAFLHPVLALVAIWVVTSRASVIARPQMWISVALISTGCIFMSLKPSTVLHSDRTSWLCSISVLVMILRNIVIRHLVAVEITTVKLRRKRVIFGVVTVAGIVVLVINMLASKLWLFPSLCAVVTCALSAAWIYVATQVLKSYTVTFVSIFCSWAALVEAAVLTPNDHRPDILVILFALMLVFCGHYLFIKDHVDYLAGDGPPTLIMVYPPKPANTHEQYTRIEFLLFASLVIGVIFFVLQPKVSQRDLNTLSYVGLDKVIRQLLTLKVKDEVPVVEEQGQVQLP